MDDSLPGRSDSSSIYGRMRQYTRCKGNSKETAAASSEVETTKAETAAESEKETAAEDGTAQADERVQQVIRRVWICRLQLESTI